MAGERPRSVYDVLRQRFGVDIMIDDSSGATSIGTTDIIVAPGNPRRMALVITNLSANTVYLRPMGAASSTKGITLLSNGGSLTLSWEDDLHLPALEWHGIASAAASAVYVVGVLIR